MKPHKHFYIAMAVLAFSAVLAQVYYRWLESVGAGESVPLNHPLSTIPLTLGSWKGIDAKMTADVELVVASKEYVRRTYHRGTSQLQFYAVYFGGVRGTAPHHPDVCMPGAGWHNVQSDVVSWQVPGFGEDTLQVHQDVFEHRNLTRRVVVWWEYVHGRNVSSRTLQRLLWALPPSMGGKRGSVLQVQISSDFDGELSEVVEEIRNFMKLLGPHIEQVLPRSGDDVEAGGESDAPATSTPENAVKQRSRS